MFITLRPFGASPLERGSPSRGDVRAAAGLRALQVSPNKGASIYSPCVILKYRLSTFRYTKSLEPLERSPRERGKESIAALKNLNVQVKLLPGAAS